MEKQIQLFIDYIHNKKKTSLNTEMSYKRDLLKVVAYLNDHGITKWEDVVIKHFVDSMSLVKVYGGLDELIEKTKDK